MLESINSKNPTAPPQPQRICTDQNDARSSPAVILFDEVLRQRREEEGPDAAAADRDAGGERPASVEVVRNDDDSCDVTQRQAEACGGKGVAGVKWSHHLP